MVAHRFIPLETGDVGSKRICIDTSCVNFVYVVKSLKWITNGTADLIVNGCLIFQFLLKVEKISLKSGTNCFCSWMCE